MKRRSMPRRYDKKVFRQTAKQHPSNTVKSVMRGGIRR